MASLLQSWKYWLFGPTTVHLQYEFCLLICMVTLAYASMSGLYRKDLHTKDFVFLLLLTVVSSRHLLLRHWSTWTPRTIGCSLWAIPSCLFSHFIQSHLIGGQVMDRPPPAQRSAGHSTAINHHNYYHGSSSNSNHHPSATDRVSQIVGTSNGVFISNTNNNPLESTYNTNILDMLPSSLTYLIHFIYLWLPVSLQRFFKTEEPKTLPNSLRKAQQLWFTYGPSFQCVLYVIAIAHIFDVIYHWMAISENMLPWNIQAVDNELTDRAAFFHSDGVYLLNDRPEPQPKILSTLGNYSRRPEPARWDIFALLWAIATLASSMLVFCRMTVPLVDWIASGPPVRDTKLEARRLHAQQHPKKPRRFLDWFLPESSSEASTAPWVERHQSISHADRVQTSYSFLLTRLAENIILFGIAPRTHYVCRFTGHCPIGTSLLELSCLLHPMGYTQPTRRDCSPTSDLMESDPLSFWVVLLGVVVITLELLIAQTVLLQRTYLNTHAFISNDWERVQPRPSMYQLSRSIFKRNHHNQQTVWDPHRKYREGDTVAYPTVHGALYKAKCNVPEGRPEMSRFNDNISGTTSQLVLNIASWQWVIMVLVHLLAAGMIHGFCGKATWGGWVLAAHCVAGQALVQDHPPRLQRLRELNNELNASVGTELGVGTSNE